MKNVIGSPVSGENFLNRESEIARALLLMQDGNSFLLLGIRRTGKSSLLKEVALRMANNGWQTVLVNCATCKDTLQFYRDIYSAMPKSLQERFRKWIADAKAIPSRLLDWITNVFDKITLGSVEVALHQEWSAYSQPLEEIVAAFFKNEPRTALFLDELPFFFQNLGNTAHSVQAIQSTLTTLRNWRDNGLPMGIAGSLNIHLQLDHLGISRKLLAGLNSLPVEPFPPSVAEQLLQTLVASKQYDWWTPTITQRLLDLLPDYVPYFLQYAFNAVAAARCTTPEEVEETYHNVIVPGLFKDFLYQFDERLAVFTGDERLLAAVILDAVALNEPTPLTALQQDANFRYDLLIKLLDLEFLTVRGHEAYAFSLNFIRKWWMYKRNL